MDEQTDTATDKPARAPKKHRRTRRSGPRRSAEPESTAKQVPEFLLGLSDQECPVECTAECCVITGIGVCGHPHKGGIQAAQQSDPKIARRYQQARKVLVRAKVEAQQ